MPVKLSTPTNTRPTSGRKPPKGDYSNSPSAASLVGQMRAARANAGKTPTAAQRRQQDDITAIAAQRAAGARRQSDRNGNITGTKPPKGAYANPPKPNAAARLVAAAARADNGRKPPVKVNTAPAARRATAARRAQMAAAAQGELASVQENTGRTPRSRPTRSTRAQQMAAASRGTLSELAERKGRRRR